MKTNNRRKFLKMSAKSLAGIAAGIPILTQLHSAENKTKNTQNNNKKVLLVFAHTYFNDSKINRALLSNLEKAKLSNVRINNLTTKYPDSKIDIKSETELLKWADKIVLQFPLFWYNVPALLKHWEDEVLLPLYGTNTLKGKQVQVISTTGAKKDFYDNMEFSIKQMFSPIVLTFDSLNCEWVEPYLIYKPSVNKLPVAEYIAQIKS